MAESALRRSLRIKRATELAAIQRHGWSRDGSKLCPLENWKVSTETQRKAAIALTERVVRVFHAYMEGEPERVFVIASSARDASQVIRRWAARRKERLVKHGIYLRRAEDVDGLCPGPLDRLLWIRGSRDFSDEREIRSAFGRACAKRDVYIEPEFLNADEDPDAEL